MNTRSIAEWATIVIDSTEVPPDFDGFCHFFCEICDFRPESQIFIKIM
jgi:hypothetical protein